LAELEELLASDLTFEEWLTEEDMAALLFVAKSHTDLVAALRENNELLGKLIPLLLDQDDRWVVKMGNALVSAHNALAKSEGRS
jgi:hypothetical protein